jgi:acetoin utilization deacetylase AcuC-like enzyme
MSEMVQPPAVTTSSRTKQSNGGSSKGPPPIALVFSPIYVEALSFMSSIHGERDELLMHLLKVCGFLNSSLRTVIAPHNVLTASREHLEKFHSAKYLDVIDYSKTLKGLNGRVASDAVLDLLGLNDDCALPETAKEREKLWTYCRYVAGASIQCAKLLFPSSVTSVGNAAKVAINWGGGRHHGRRDKAAGFCYINDAVLAILHMRRQRKRVLYIDIDIHHADGVADAFSLEQEKLATVVLELVMVIQLTFPSPLVLLMISSLRSTITQSQPLLMSMLPMQ